MTARLEQASPSQAARRALSPAAVVVYAAGLLQGLTLVSIPALSAVLTTTLGFTQAQYGALFLPQVAMAVAGAIVGGALAARIGLKRLLVVSLAANGASQALAALSGASPGGAFIWALGATAALGLGFGLGGAPLNGLPPLLFPARRHAAVVAAHSLVGLGLAVGPVIAGAFIDGGMWTGFPWLLAALAFGLAAVVAVTPLPEATAPSAAMRGRGPVGRPAFWMFLAITVLYAFAEGTFSNWAVIYLREAKGLPEMTAGVALSAFWGALVVGRLVVSALVARVAPGVIWTALPAMMIAVFLLLPEASGEIAGVGLFALAGLACSAFLPLSITLASERFPDDVAFVSSMLIAALMVGVGVGAFAIGALREALSFETLYRVSAVYPALALLLIAILRGAGRARSGQAAAGRDA